MYAHGYAHRAGKHAVTQADGTLAFDLERIAETCCAFANTLRKYSNNQSLISRWTFGITAVVPSLAKKLVSYTQNVP